MTINRAAVKTAFRLLAAAALVDSVASAVHLVVLHGHTIPPEAYAIVPLFLVGALAEAALHPERYRSTAAPEKDTFIFPPPVANPATGQLMIGGVGSVDTSGNPYGFNRSERHY